MAINEREDKGENNRIAWSAAAYVRDYTRALHERLVYCELVRNVEGRSELVLDLRMKGIEIWERRGGASRLQISRYKPSLEKPWSSSLGRERRRDGGAFTGPLPGCRSLPWGVTMVTTNKTTHTHTHNQQHVPYTYYISSFFYLRGVLKDLCVSSAYYTSLASSSSLNHLLNASLHGVLC